jgi:hypothetical protein
MNHGTNDHMAQPVSNHGKTPEAKG